MMGLDLQPDLCSLLIDDVIYHEAAVRQAGAEALSQAVARYQRQAAEVMGRLMEIYQEKLYVSSLCTLRRSGWCQGGSDSAQPLTCSRQESWSSLWLRVAVTGHNLTVGRWLAQLSWESVAAYLSTCLLQRPPPVLDALGRVISESPPDQWEARYNSCCNLVPLRAA